MPICSTCKIQLNEDNAYKKGKRLQSYCKPCMNKIFQDRWKQRKLDAIQYKGGKCQVCGYSKYYGALEFHHRNPEEKEFAWQKMRLVSKDRLTAELDKCDLLCANCHREVHVELRSDI